MTIILVTHTNASAASGSSATSSGVRQSYGPQGSQGPANKSHSSWRA